VQGKAAKHRTVQCKHVGHEEGQMLSRTRTSRSKAWAAVAVLGVLTVVLAAVMASPASATTPGSNGRIAYKHYLDADRTTGAIFTIRPNGEGTRQITWPSAGTVDDQPDWSPDGSLVAFRRCVPDTVCAIYTVHADGSHLRRLSPECDATAPDIETKCPDESEVAFMPDGRHVVYTRSTGLVREFPGGEGFIEHSDVVIRDLSGEHSRVILRSRPFAGDNNEMVASPDGLQIAFRRENSPLASPAGGIALFVMRSDGSHVRRITPWSLKAGDHPDWSPDGRWILFRSNENGDFLDSQLYVVHPDGSGRRPVTHVSPDTMLLSASFSPDGTKVVYSRSGDSGQPDIFTARVDGSHVQQVTHTPLWDSAPDWGPAKS
jgi:Tol biopolymer transport system component